MKKKRALVLVIAALLLVTAACGGGAKGGETAAARPASSADSAGGWDAQESMDMGIMDPTATEAGGGSSVYQNSGTKLIRRAELSIQTERFDEAAAALEGLVSGCGGYFETSSVYGGGIHNTNATRRGEYVVRIPAERYDEFFRGTGDLGYVVSSTESSEDIGELYFDTESRLKSQRIKQERLLSLLEQAATMEDIIGLENALSDTEYQIEQLTSTLNRYDSLVGFSTFTICLDEVRKVNEVVGETASLAERMAAGFAASLEGFGRGCQDLLVWLSYHLLGLVVLAAAAAAAGFAGWRILRKHRAKRRGTEEQGR